jgi:hypothetical protein
MLTPINCQWFTSRSKVGIVMAEDELGEIFYLIGTGDGLNEVIDINIITSFGAQFPRAIGDALFGRGAPAVAERPASAKRVPTVVKKGAPAKKAITRSPRKSGK